MSALRSALADYLTIRRALGYRLVRTEKLLAQFVSYMERTGEELVTIERAVAWATLPAGASAGWRGQRLQVVRGFAGHLASIDPRHQVPPADLLPQRTARAIPYLYTDAEIAALMAAAEILPAPLRVLTLRTLIGLLAATGLRVGEAISLDRGDLDLEAGLLTVRAGKFGKAREVPLHPSSVAALADYLARRDRLRPHPPSPALFISLAGTRLLYSGVHLAFLRLVRHAGLGRRCASCRPRPHDLRHTFAVRTLLEWYRAGADVPALLPRLSTYLGHVSPSATYWYLQAAPELLALAGARLEQHLQGRA